MLAHPNALWSTQPETANFCFPKTGGRSRFWLKKRWLLRLPQLFPCSPKLGSSQPNATLGWCFYVADVKNPATCCHNQKQQKQINNCCNFMLPLSFWVCLLLCVFFFFGIHFVFFFTVLINPLLIRTEHNYATRLQLISTTLLFHFTFTLNYSSNHGWENIHWLHMRKKTLVMDYVDLVWLCLDYVIISLNM